MRDYTYEPKMPSAAEREARKAFRTVEAKQVMTDYARAQKAFHENRERLKAARLARDAEAASRPSGKVR